MRHFSPSTLRKLRNLGRSLNALSRMSPAMAGRLTFRLFCSPRRKPMDVQDKNFLLAAQQPMWQAEGMPISTYRWEPTGEGNGRQVLFLHGWESNSARWRQYIKALRKKGFQVWAFDAPRSGLSGGDRLNVLLFSKVVKQFLEEKGHFYAVVGHSLGGGAAVMSAALLGGPRPEKMVLLAAFAETERVIRDFSGYIGANETVIQRVFHEIERQGGIPIHEYSVAQKITLLSDVQGLVMHDEHDDVAPVEEGRLLAERWGAAYIETQEHGHRMQHSSVVRAVRDFLEI
ncbi:MAG: alpha/beta fold hydrolase [Bacteroidetes bacterium]|nr:alpha/beta fold hydrolase [Bacteroidota bacterium]